jgi:hypothetical protein
MTVAVRPGSCDNSLLASPQAEPVDRPVSLPSTSRPRSPAPSDSLSLATPLPSGLFIQSVALSPATPVDELLPSIHGLLLAVEHCEPRGLADCLDLWTSDRLWEW